MATTKTATNTSKPKTAAPKRKPAPRATAAKPSAQSATTSSTRPASRVAQVGQLAERAVLIPVGVALEARDRVADLVATTRRNLGSNVEAVSSRVETVVQNGVNAGIKLVNGAQDRISRVS